MTTNTPVVEYEGIETTTNGNYFAYLVVSIRAHLHLRAVQVSPYSTTDMG